MFCERCGNQLPDTADFCPKCGNEFSNQGNAMNNSYGNARNNKEVLLEVRPTFKFTYIVLPKLLKELIVFIPFIIMMIYFISTMNRMTSSYGYSSSSIGLSAFMPIILIFIGVPLLRILFVIGKAFFDKKQYQNYVYTFYGDRVVFRDSFLNVSEKELKYRNIREITKRQTFIQRYFNIGNIVLFSNAESGFVNGVFMVHIEDVDDVYRKVKEIINV